jgi:Flp pilus assembly protein TadD
LSTQAEAETEAFPSRSRPNFRRAPAQAKPDLNRQKPEANLNILEKRAFQVGMYPF